MIRSRVLIAVSLTAVVAACQRAPEPAAAPPSTTAPVSETTLAPAPPAAQAPEAAPYTIAPAAPAPSRERETTAPRASTRTHTAPAPRETTATRPGSTHSDRVERTPAAEPIDIPTDAPRRGAAEPCTRTSRASTTSTVGGRFVGDF